uniref:B box-type domain-containing protein n=2 Tax=Seriola lalandi dorsalis TaxID=1841481 RepID=A0A3B4WCR0_SERLL
MASRPEEYLHCPVCHEIFQEPVLLSCSHSFCRACLSTWWTQNRIKYLLNLCEHFLREKTERPSAGSASVCSLHSEELRLFCLDHLQLVCVVCLHSETHRNHSFSPIDEAARDYKQILRELLKPLQEKMELFTDIKGNFDQAAKDVEVQAQDRERQIKDAILMLQNLLQKEERERMEALSKEKLLKTKMLKTESETLSKDTADLSDTIRATEETLRAEDVSFLQTYKTAAQTVQSFPLNNLQPMSEALIDLQFRHHH